MGLQRVTESYNGVTWGYRELQRLQGVIGVTRGYRGLQWVRGGYKGLQGVT